MRKPLLVDWDGNNADYADAEVESVWSLALQALGTEVTAMLPLSRPGAKRPEANAERRRLMRTDRGLPMVP